MPEIGASRRRSRTNLRPQFGCNQSLLIRFNRYQFHRRIVSDEMMSLRCTPSRSPRQGATFKICSAQLPFCHHLITTDLPPRRAPINSRYPVDDVWGIKTLCNTTSEQQYDDRTPPVASNFSHCVVIPFPVSRNDICCVRRLVALEWDSLDAGASGAVESRTGRLSSSIRSSTLTSLICHDR